MTPIPDVLATALFGVHGIHVTPYTSDGLIDESGIEAIVSRIVRAGVHAVVTGGNTGEFFSLSLDEIVRCQHAVVRRRESHTAMIAGVGRSLPEAIQLAKSAEELGYHALMVHQPVDPFSSSEGTVGYIRRLADETRLPLILYVRADSLGVHSIASLASIESVVGVKFARPNVVELARCMEAAGGRLAWICGLAEQWAPAFYAVGARGFTSGLVNIAPKQSLSIHAALESGDFGEARRLVSQIADFEDLRTLDQGGANVTVIKEALNRLGPSVGPVRPPGSPHLPQEASERLASILQRWAEWGLTPREGFA